MRFILFIILILSVYNINAQNKERIKGESFVFGVQGDSHPERSGKMFSDELYRINMLNVAKSNPDFYFILGDDSNIDRFIEKGNATQWDIDKVYKYQKSFTNILSCPIYPVVGNHEQIAKYMLTGDADNAAVYSALAMKKYFPIPDSFSGNNHPVEHVGIFKDYYAFEHGDALFVVLDPYWHSDAPVDNIPGDKMRGKKGQNPTKNSWAGTLGKVQYEWLKETLSQSLAKYKFVFAHHVNGSGRGGIECANLYEWGGYGRNGKYEFTQMRPNWDMPIHQLFIKYGVTIFFQGHDHVFCKQELNGIVYQSCPNPADNSYTAFNSNAYLSGDLLPNAGYIRVTVCKTHIKVDYIRAFLKGDGNNEEVAYSYTIK